MVLKQVHLKMLCRCRQSRILSVAVIIIRLNPSRPVIVSAWTFKPNLFARTIVGGGQGNCEDTYIRISFCYRCET